MCPTLRLGMPAILALLVTAPAVAQPTSDDFHCPLLKSYWILLDPSGEGSDALVGSGTAEAYLTLSFPAGTPHDAWGAGGANESIRITQPCVDADLEIDVKWLSEPTGGFNDQGILIEQDGMNWLRFDVYHNNSSLKLFIGKTVAGVNTSILNANITAGSASHVRVTRSGDTWTTSTSPDGVTWQAQNNFVQAMSVVRAGVYAANPVEGLAWTSEVDYFLNTASPFVEEDPENTDDCFVVPTESTSWGRIKSRY